MWINGFPHHDSPVLRLDFSDGGFLIFNRQFEQTEFDIALFFFREKEKEKERVLGGERERERALEMEAVRREGFL